MYQIHKDFPRRTPVTSEQLEAVLNAKIVKTQDIPGPLIIESIRMVLCGETCLVITRTADGLEGISVTNYYWKFFHPILEKKIAPYLIGTDARDLEATLDSIYVQEYNYKIGLAYLCCVSWIELSILDLLGKAAGKPVGELFGPRCCDEVNFYCASVNRGTTVEEEIEFLAERVAKVGAKAIKFKVGGRMSKDADAFAGRSEGLIYKTRQYFGDDMIINADGNGSYSPKVAIGYGKMLEEINAYFYEEPCPFDHIWETKEVADALTIPISFGEQETSMRRFKWLIENDAAQVIQPDIMYNGGFIRTSKVARMAELAGIPIAIHLSEGIEYAYILMLASFTPNMGKYQELKEGFEETRGFFTTDLTLKDGKINIPTGDGLGMAFTKAFFKNAVTVFDCVEKRPIVLK